MRDEGRLPIGTDLSTGENEHEAVGEEEGIWRLVVAKCVCGGSCGVEGFS